MATSLEEGAMTDLVTIQHVLNPVTGELIPAEDVNGVAEAVKGLRELKAQIADAIADATVILVAESKRQGTKTLALQDVTVEIRGGTETAWDVQELRTNLEALQIPEERLRALIKTEVTYKVDARVAKQLAGANEDYAAVLESAKTTVEKPYYIRVKEGEPF